MPPPAGFANSYRAVVTGGTGAGTYNMVWSEPVTGAAQNGWQATAGGVRAIILDLGGGNFEFDIGGAGDYSNTWFEAMDAWDGTAITLNSFTQFNSPTITVPSSVAISPVVADSSGLSTNGPGAFPLADLSPGQSYNFLQIVNEGPVAGHYSINGGDTWARIPAAASATAPAAVYSRERSSTAPVFKRDGGSDMSGVFATLSWIDFPMIFAIASLVFMLVQ